MVRRKRENKILVEHDTWLEIDVSTTKHPEAVMFIDKDDWERLQNIENRGHIYAVRYNPSNNTLYAQCHINGAKPKMKQVHRLILPGDHKETDHINHNGLDNRRCNLMPCTKRQNQSNRLNQGVSEYVGVWGDKQNTKWCAYIRINKKLYYLGYFEIEQEASETYQKALKNWNEHGILPTRKIKRLSCILSKVNLR